MKAAGFGRMIVTGGGFADHPIPALATVSPGKAALRSAATMLGVDLGPDGIRVATLTIAGQIAARSAFDLPVSRSATGRSSRWTIPGRRNSASPASKTQPPEGVYR
jgi:enoyl-[acyl-carrier-protein] reductase (NADH)